MCQGCFNQLFLRDEFHTGGMAGLTRQGGGHADAARVHGPLWWSPRCAPMPTLRLLRATVCMASQERSPIAGARSTGSCRWQYPKGLYPSLAMSAIGARRDCQAEQWSSLNDPEPTLGTRTSIWRFPFDAVFSEDRTHRPVGLKFV
jgi:hypothetical protein